MRSKTHILLGVMAVFVLILGANLNNRAIAEDKSAENMNETVGLTVSPSIDKLGDLKPGESYKRKIKVENPSEKMVAFKILASSFWVEGSDYEIKWGVSDSQFGRIAKWTDIDQSKVYELEAGETYVLEYTIEVPEDAAGGSQHLMVTVSIGSNGTGGFVTSEMHLNTLIYANIEGEMIPGVDIESHEIQGFSLAPNVKTVSVVKNTGNVDIDVRYKIYASSFFSGEQAYMAEEEKVLMVDSTQVFEQNWTNAPRLGVFNVTQEIMILGEVHTFTSVVWMCPLWLIIALGIAIVMMVVYIIYRYNFRKKHKRS